jgi:hypothetical protein
MRFMHKEFPKVGFKTEAQISEKDNEDKEEEEEEEEEEDLRCLKA